MQQHDRAACSILDRQRRQIVVEGADRCVRLVDVDQAIGDRVRCIADIDAQRIDV